MIAAAWCVAIVLGSHRAFAEPLVDESVFMVAASCPGTTAPGRTGTAVLVANFPDAGETSLLTALHVVHGCSRVEVYGAGCSSVDKGDRVATFPNQGSSVTVWKDRDVAVFRHVEGIQRFQSHKPASLALDQAVPDAPDPVQVFGAVKANCFAGAALITARRRVDDISKHWGSLPGSAPIMEYMGTATRGASGGPVARKGDGAIVAMHEAGFRTTPLITSAIVLAPGPSAWGDATDLALSAEGWKAVAFEAPPEAHAADAAEGDETSSALAPERSFNAFVATAVLSGPRSLDGYRIGVRWVHDAELSRSDDLAGSNGVRFALDGFVWSFKTQFRDPADQPVESTDGWGGGVAGTLGWVHRFWRLSRCRMSGALAWRLGTVGHSPPQSAFRFDVTTGPIAQLQLALSVPPDTGILLIVEGGTEYGPALSYRYTGLGADLASNPSRFGPVLGVAVGLEL